MTWISCIGEFNALRRCKNVVVCTVICICGSARAQNGPSLSDTARLLAGMPVTGTLGSHLPAVPKWSGFDDRHFGTVADTIQ
jgi:hypothetical protein